MENKDQLPEKEVIKTEPFQAEVNPQNQEKEDGASNAEREGYTPGETEFADGKNTRLGKESEDLEIDRPTDDLDDLEIDPEGDRNSASSLDDEDAEFENPEDDPA